MREAAPPWMTGARYSRPCRLAAVGALHPNPHPTQRAAHAPDPAAPASVLKQCPKAAMRSGSWASGRIWSMHTPPSGISAVPVRHMGESLML